MRPSVRGPEQSQMMIQPEDIRRKAENLYPDYLRAWLDGEDTFFPRIIPARRTLDGDNFSAAIQSVRRLREGSKEVTGFGYTVEWQEVNSRKFGRNRFPARILFETPCDFLRFTGKQREFSVFARRSDSAPRGISAVGKVDSVKRAGVDRRRA